MIIVIIAGGSGSRLWPLSTPDYPKHLLKVNGDDLSLLQHAYARACHTTTPNKIYVISEIGHIDHVKSQLSDMPEDHFIVEPARRGTASCILATLHYLKDRHPADEPMVTIPADHFIRDVDTFTRIFHIANSVASTQSRLVLVGVEPDYPNTGLGYIEKGDLFDEEHFIFNVKAFKEKPNHALAQTYLKSGRYLWNCNYPMASRATYESVMKQYAPEMYASYQKLLGSTPETYKEVYLSLENIALDYALNEKVPDLLVVPGSFDWMDIGVYADMYKVVPQDEKGNYIEGNVEMEDVSGSYILNQQDIPLAVIGLDNVVVVNTPNGIVVARKDLSQKVGEVSKRFK